MLVTRIFSTVIITSIIRGEYLEPESQKMCLGLNHTSENVRVSCYSPQATTHSTNGNSCITPQKPGTIAKYSCTDYFIPFEHIQGEPLEHELKCDTNGYWRRLSKFNSFMCIQDCGRRRISHKPLIINGLSTNTSFFPWHVNLYRNPKWERRRSEQVESFAFICGGSIVRNSIILTAAHCIASNDGHAIDPSAFRVIVGAKEVDFDLNVKDTNSQVLSVKRIHVHDAYAPSNDYQADIAIIQLEEPIEFNDFISPICLPTETALEVEFVQPGKFGEVTGFGTDEHGRFSNTLKVGTLQIKSRAECYRSLTVRLSESGFCAGTTQGTKNSTTLCNGDSGGGFVFPSTLFEKYYIYVSYIKILYRDVVDLSSTILNSQGITSFTNRAREHEKACQNNAVFTRVLPFMPWIRTIIEEIHGSILAELTANSMVPYVQSGNDKNGSHRQRFGAITSGIDHKITSIELNNLLVDGDELLKSLQHTPFITTLNLTNVKLEKFFSSKVRLPYLSTFILDINSYTYPTSLRSLLLSTSYQKLSDFIKACLFFYKEYDDDDADDWKFENLLPLRMNIQLTIEEYKLIHITQLSSVEDQIQLQELSLKDCELNISDLIRQRNVIRNLESLRLHSTTYWDEDSKLSDLIQKIPRLEELVVLDSESGTRKLYLSQLPRTLKYISVNVYLKNRDRPSFYDNVDDPMTSDDIMKIYQDQANIAIKLPTFPNLHTFYCDLCSMDDEIIQNFGHIFPNLRHFGIKTNERVDLNRIVDGLKYLELFYISSSSTMPIILSFSPSFKSFSNNELTFYGPLFGFHDMTLSTQMFEGEDKIEVLVRKSFINGSWSWTEQYPKTGWIEYQFKRYNDFWTSFEEKLIRRRLEVHEAEAVRTSNYVYEGQPSAIDQDEFGEVWTYDRRLFDLKIIALTGISLSKVKISSKDLVRVLANSDKLKSVELTHIYLYGLFRRKTYAQADLDDVMLRFDVVDDVEMSAEESAKITKSELDALIPFLTTNSLCPVERDGSRVSRFSLGYPSIIRFSYSIPQQSLYLHGIDFVNQLLSSYWDPSTDFIIKDLRIWRCNLNLDLLPSTLEFLRLGKISVEGSTTSHHTSENGFIWSILKSLKHLTLMELSSSSLNKQQIQIDVSEPIKLNSLEHLVISYAHLTLTNSQTLRSTLSSLQSLWLDTCTLDESLLINNTIWKILPTFTIIAIRFRTLPFSTPARMDYEKLFVSALKNEQLYYIYGTFLSHWLNPETKSNTTDLYEIQRILRLGGVLDVMVSKYAQFQYTANYLHKSGYNFNQPQNFVIQRRWADGVWIYNGSEVNLRLWNMNPRFDNGVY